MALARDSTMETAVKEGVEFLEKSSPVLAEKCKKAVSEAAENGAGDAPEPVKNGSNGGESATKLPKENTVTVTDKEGTEDLEKQEDANTELNTEEDEKCATKRSAEGETEQEVDEAKKQKTEEEKEPNSNGDSEKKGTNGDSEKKDTNQDSEKKGSNGGAEKDSEE